MRWRGGVPVSRPEEVGVRRSTLLLDVITGAVAIALVAACSRGATSSETEGTTPATTPSTAVDIPASYAHPEVLADVDWVAAHLDDPTVRVVDARMPLEAELYATGHIPGAVYLNVFEDICCPSSIMPADQFAQVMGRFGIGDDTTVVLYDTDGGLWAARLWWALRYYGHEQVKLLNGGLRQWIYAGQPLEMTSPTVAPAVFTPDVVVPWRATIDEVRQAVDDPAVALVDALPRASYDGDLVLYDRPGHIATALSLPYNEIVDGITTMVLEPAALSQVLERLQLDPRQRVITHCGGGNAGSNLAFVLYLMGFDKVGLYDGSLGEWSSDPSNPMETVP
jgi:thiosulfate/3-mercaptopyruvate sulfurtransferase